MTKKYVITITRQFGSLGRLIAQDMSKKLGIEFYDRDIVEETAKKLDLPCSVINENEEYLSHVETNPFVRMAFPLGRNANAFQDKIFKAQENIINYVVEKDSCIVVGRCADYILLDHPNALHIYIHAPYEKRVAKSVDVLGLDINEAKRTIHEVDEARDAYHQHYAGFKPNDMSFKHISIDSSVLGVEGTADVLVDIIKKKFDLE